MHKLRATDNMCRLFSRGGVEDTRLEAKAKAKDTKKIRGQGQGQPFRQTLSRPRTGMLEAKAKDQGHKAQVLSKKKKKKRSSQKFFRRSPKKKKKKKKKGLHKNFLGDLHEKTLSKNVSTAPQNFNFPKNAAVLEDRPIFEDLRPRGQGQGLDLRGQGHGQGLQNLSSRTPPLLFSAVYPVALTCWF